MDTRYNNISNYDAPHLRNLNYKMSEPFSAKPDFFL